MREKIADYILVRDSEIVYETSSEIVSKVKVGEGTLNRFCKKIGYSGFQELKLKMTKDILELESQKMSSDTFIDEIKNNYLSIVESTRKLIDGRQIELAIKLIREANQILMIGVGSSGNAAREFESSLLRIGIISKTVIDTHFQLMHTALLKDNDLIIAFSLSGSTKEVEETLLNAKRKNVKIISITNYSSRNIAKLSDCVLLTSKKESYLEGGSLMAKASQLFIIDVICTRLSLINYEDTICKKEEIASLLSNKVE
ncbi:TPA: MurR/RpiR family transcriptional regulator [Streptococcus pneumoniae]|uniref:MurR/RpiR family transcriptional regulator n=7 Tax=Streptococcus pneumoniae TaxID=1313 RepID=UPI001CB76ABB|nr:MurR/RpiR family transcriptional regulator [Streptococcus pneumoniae]MDR7841542.1 MurR/RpiR family transcriptional regulator [Streptococcus pneumoniae]MDS2301204.1 MurR/RpiR family transcriptional regulator [Streptococcus pneumoniae]MDS2353251.1 MurR/RpiR family transcriptional regulator [Streptococcus pneumoniae]MDS2414213.1 MurR/RpiR family transcriptional regulator [Streptococcus pneumoniae]MDS2474190.1 MurR/RpiR family transcriptional regulator [Streptococcus pneumoniae]